MPQAWSSKRSCFGVASACRSVLVRTRVEWPVRLPVSAQHRVHRRLCRPTKQVSHRVIEPLSANVRGHQSGHTSEPRSGDECLHTDHLNHISALTISSAAICRKPLQRQAEPRSLSPQTDQGKIMGIHRKNNRSHAKRFVTTAAGAGALALACTIVTTSVASAHDWSQVAVCESSGDWNINTGNGFYGGLQFTQSTWDAYKPASAPARADLASTADQVAAAEATLSAQDIGAWPVCGVYLGWGGTTPDSTTSAPSSEDSAGDTVTVSEGDTLLDLASAKGFRWQDVWARNARIPDPDQIRVGDVIQF